MDVQLKLPELPAAPAVQTLRGVLHASISRWIKSVIMTRQVIHRANLICNCFRTESTEWKESAESSQTQIWPRLNQQHHTAFIMTLENVSQEKHSWSSHFKLTLWPQILPGTSCIECEADGVRPGMVRGEKWFSRMLCEPQAPSKTLTWASVWDLMRCSWYPLLCVPSIFILLLFQDHHCNWPITLWCHSFAIVFI